MTLGRAEGGVARDGTDPPLALAHAQRRMPPGTRRATRSPTGFVSALSATARGSDAWRAEKSSSSSLQSHRARPWRAAEAGVGRSANSTSARGRRAGGGRAAEEAISVTRQASSAELLLVPVLSLTEDRCSKRREPREDAAASLAARSLLDESSSMTSNQRVSASLPASRQVRGPVYSELAAVVEKHPG